MKAKYDNIGTQCAEFGMSLDARCPKMYVKCTSDDISILLKTGLKCKTSL